MFTVPAEPNFHPATYIILRFSKLKYSAAEPTRCAPVAKYLCRRLFYSHSYTSIEKWAELTVGFTETIALHHVSGCKAGAVKQTASDQLSMTHFVKCFNTIKMKIVLRIDKIKKYID